MSEYESPPDKNGAPADASLAVSSRESEHREVAAILSHLREVVRRQWSTFFAVFMMSAVAVQALAFVWPATYEARAAVLLRKARMSAGVDSDPTAPTTVMADTVSEEEVNSEIAILTSREVLDKTVSVAGLDRLPPPLYVRILFAPLRAYEWAYAWWHQVPLPSAEERARTGLGNSISVVRQRDSNVLVVAYQAGDPRFAEVVLDQLLREYLDRHVAVHGMLDIKPFFSSQAELLRQEVEKAQQNLASLKSSVDVIDFGTERELLLRQLTDLRQEELLLRRQLAELDARLATVSDGLHTENEWMPTSATLKPEGQGTDQMRAELLRLEIEQIGLESRFTDDSPLVRENKAKLDAARRALESERNALARESTSGLNPSMVSLRQEEARLARDRAGTRRRLSVVQRQVASQRERLLALDTKTAEADRLDLDLDSAKQRYLMYLQRTERARMDEALDLSRVTNVSVVQQANAAMKPVRPRRLITALLGIGVGVVVALLVCAKLEIDNFGLVILIDTSARRTRRHLEGLQ